MEPLEAARSAWSAGLAPDPASDSHACAAASMLQCTIRHDGLIK
jgi:hypothetical protein